MEDNNNYKEAFFKSLDMMAEVLVIATITSQLGKQNIMKSVDKPSEYKHITFQDLGQGKTRKTVQFFTVDNDGYLTLLDTKVTDEETS